MVSWEEAVVSLLRPSKRGTHCLHCCQEVKGVPKEMSLNILVNFSATKNQRTVLEQQKIRDVQLGRRVAETSSFILVTIQ